DRGDGGAEAVVVALERLEGGDLRGEEVGALLGGGVGAAGLGLGFPERLEPLPGGVAGGPVLLDAGDEGPILLGEKVALLPDAGQLVLDLGALALEALEPGDGLGGPGVC